MKRKIIAVCIGVFCLFKANAQITQVVDISTGVYNNTTSIIPANGTNTDDTWVLIAPSSATLYSASFSPSWVSSSNAGWISPVVINHDGYYDDGLAGHHNAGTLQYRMSFSAYACTISQAIINLTEFAGDNTVQSIQVNSNTPHSISASFGSLSSTSVNVMGEIVAGTTNTITITVANTGYSQTGLLVYGNLTINYNGDPTLVTNITGPSSVCLGDALTFSGATSTGTATHHVWTVVESNAAGVAVAGATEWWSTFVTGNPGSFTIPLPGAGGPTIVCGKYYRVKLALTAPCDEWDENFKVVYINCIPVANAGPDKTICEGSCTTIGAGKTPLGITYIWTDAQGYVGTGKPITVCPTTTTTYTLTATDNETECAATDVVTIFVQTNDPSFNLATNSVSGSGYYTAVATPVDLAAASTPGFAYSWTVEEIVSLTNTTVISGSQATSSCWVISGFITNFNGYDGPLFTSTGSNPMTGGCSSPSVGHFTSGHTYRIKRKTMTSACSWKEISALMAVTNGMATIQYTATRSFDEASEAETESIENSLNLNVYPNPSKGIFTIELNNSTKNSMEIYDMLGNKVKEAQVTGSYQLDLTGYAKGVYMIKMIVNDKAVMKKIIVE